MKTGIRKKTALLLAAVMCIDLCTGLAAGAEEVNESVGEQAVQTEADGIGSAQKEEVSEEAEASGTEEQETENAETDITVVPEKTDEQEQQEVSENEEKEQNQELESSEEMTQMTSSGASAAGLNSPRIVEDSGMEAKQKVTWDCVWFGSYPQTEVISSRDTYIAVDEERLKEGDLIVDSNLYTELQDADGWDSNNDITVDGNRYRRMEKEDATYAISDKNYYNWSGSTWHYFKYEPIKWRVLKIDGNQAFLLSDIVLDDQRYYPEEVEVTWEDCTIRSWLNGYSASANMQGTDYSGKNFIGSAFTSGEQSTIVSTSMGNADNSNDGVQGGKNMTDKVFLLSAPDVYGDSAKPYGFASGCDIFDEARRCKSSVYAKAMGVYSNSINASYRGCCYWWMRMPGDDSVSAALAYDSGWVRPDIYDVHKEFRGVRPALNLNLSSDQWSYAGTVCSDGTMKDAIKAEEIKLSKTSIELTVGETEKLTAEILPANASIKTVTWSSEDSGIAKVDESGTITAVSAGKTIVYCKTADGSVTSKCDVLVKEPQKNPNNNPSNTGSNKGNSDKVTNTAIKVSKITLSGNSKKIAAGKKIKLTAEVTPSNAKNKAVTWKSSNTKVATVNSKGVVTLKKNSGGKKVTITATAKDGSKKKATYQITSMKGVVKKVAISGKKTRTLKAGKTLKLKAKVTASNSKKANKTLKWTSSNTKYAKVSSKGVVKTYKKGKRKTVKITAMATDGSGKKYSINVKIK